MIQTISNSVFTIISSSLTKNTKRGFQTSFVFAKYNDEPAKLLKNARLFMNLGREEEHKLFNETLEECGFKEAAFTFDYKERKVILKTDVDTLIKSDLLKPNADLEAYLLQHFETFPYTRFLKTLINKNRYSAITLRKLKDSIEKQYLSWKFNVHLDILNAMYSCYSSCLPPSRSFGSFKRKLEELNQCQEFIEASVPNKMYLLTINPFKKEYVKDFKSSFAGISWDKLGKLYPKVIKKPFGALMELLNFLEGLNFTQEQIQNALPAFKNNFITISSRMRYLLSSKKFHAFEQDSQYLTLLCYPVKILESHTWEELEEKRASFVKLRDYKSQKFLLYYLHYELNNLLNIDCEDFANLRRHRKVTTISWGQIQDSVEYLRENFNDKEIKETIQIILYPRETIEKGFNIMKANAQNLKEFGFNNGHVAHETNIFNHGTTLRNKTLQLCLYYIEKPHDFSGMGAII